MLYFIGGAPRTGKSTLTQQFAAGLGLGWVSTDFLLGILRLKGDPGVKTEWDASPKAIRANAEWFFPYLERFAWSVSSSAEGYVIEGVDFLPAQVVQLSARYQIRPVFLGCSEMTKDRFDRYPGRSPGYAHLPADLRQQMAGDIPRWSEFIQQQAVRFACPYIDMVGEFQERLAEAKSALSSPGLGENGAANKTAPS